MFSTVDSGLTNLIHDRYNCTLFTLSSVSSSACLFHAWKVASRGWMCPLKREQARREWDSELRLVNSL